MEKSVGCIHGGCSEEASDGSFEHGLPSDGGLLTVHTRSVLRN